MRVDGLYPSGQKRGADQVDVLVLYHLPSESDTVVCLGICLLQLHILALLGLVGRQYISGALTSYSVGNNGFTQFYETGKLQTMHRRRRCKVYQRWRAPPWGLLPALRRWSLPRGMGGLTLMRITALSPRDFLLFLYFPQTLFETANEVRRSTATSSSPRDRGNPLSAANCAVEAHRDRRAFVAGLRVIRPRRLGPSCSYMAQPIPAVRLSVDRVPNTRISGK